MDDHLETFEVLEKPICQENAQLTTITKCVPEIDPMTNCGKFLLLD